MSLTSSAVELLYSQPLRQPRPFKRFLRVLRLDRVDQSVNDILYIFFINISSCLNSLEEEKTLLLHRSELPGSSAGI